MKIHEAFNHALTSYAFLPDEKNWILPTCYIGLEWEFELGSVYLTPQIRKMYLIKKEDGSLRDAGMEICFPTPLFGKDLTFAIDTLKKALIAAGEDHNVTNYRTGFHVHLDVRDLSLEEVHTLLLIYAVVEPAIFRLAGEARINSNFCVPWFRCEEQLRALRIISQVGEEQNKTRLTQLVVAIQGLERYSALNCQALSKFGSLEFRHFENVKEELLIGVQKAYINLCMALKRASQSGYVPIDILSMAEKLPPDELIKELLGTDERLPILHMTEDERDESLVIAKELIDVESTSKWNIIDLSKHAGEFPGWRVA